MNLIKNKILEWLIILEDILKFYFLAIKFMNKHYCYLNSSINYCAVISLILLSFNGVQKGITEELAMGTIGYQSKYVALPYPHGKYAMKEPFSSEPIVSYEYKYSDLKTSDSQVVILEYDFE